MGGSHAVFLIWNQSGITRTAGNKEPVHLKELQDAEGKRESKVRDVGSYVSRPGGSKPNFRGSGMEGGGLPDSSTARQ